MTTQPPSSKHGFRAIPLEDFDREAAEHFARTNGTSVEEIGRTALPRDGMDTLAVSASGMNIIAYDADNASALAVMRAIR